MMARFIFVVYVIAFLMISSCSHLGGSDECDVYLLFGCLGVRHFAHQAFLQEKIMGISPMWTFGEKPVSLVV